MEFVTPNIQFKVKPRDLVKQPKKSRLVTNIGSLEVGDRFSLCGDLEKCYKDAYIVGLSPCSASINCDISLDGGETFKRVNNYTISLSTTVRLLS